MFLKKISVLLISSLCASFAMHGAGLESEVEAKRQKETTEIQIPATPVHPSTQPCSVVAEALDTARSKALFKEGDWKILERVIGRVESILDKYSPEVIREISKKVEAESRAEISVSTASLSQSGASAAQVEVERKQKAEETHKSLDAPDITKPVSSPVLLKFDAKKYAELRKQQRARALAAVSGHIAMSIKMKLSKAGTAFDIEHKLKKAAESPEKLKDSGAGVPDDSIAVTEEIDSALKESIMLSCPLQIKNDVSLWKEYLAGAISKRSFSAISKRFLLVGAPGTGKTTMGKAIAAECGIPCFMHDGTSIATSYKDSGPGNLDKIFTHAAHHMPCVLIIDEIGALLQRYHNKHDTENSMLIKLWRKLDEYEEKPILFIATANDLEDAPGAFESRFGNSRIKFFPPSQNEREATIKHYEDYLSEGDPKVFAGIDVKNLAANTNYFCQRHLKQLMGDALRIYLGRKTAATTSEYDSIISKIKSSDSSLNYSKYWAKARSIVTEYAPAAVGHAIQLGLHEDNVKLQTKHHGDSMSMSKASMAMSDRHHKETMAAGDRHHQASLDHSTTVAVVQTGVSLLTAAAAAASRE